jgi:plasmid stability protein
VAAILIRNLDERTVARLKARAARNRQSLQAELRAILERAAAMNVIESRTLAEQIRRKLGDRQHTDAAALIADDRRR